MRRYDSNLEDIQPHIIKRLVRYVLIFFSVSVLFLCTTLIFFILSLQRNHTILKLEDTIEVQQYIIDKDDVLLTLETNIGHYLMLPKDSIAECNDSVLYAFLTANGAWYPDILLRQAKIESGNYTSSIYKSNNNLYGMKKVNKRQTTQTDIKNGYGYYRNWQLSVLDRILWDIYTFGDKPSKDTYYNAMGIYAEDSNYKNKLL